MSQHYYSNQPESKHDRKIIEEQLNGTTYRFVSDAGVFSKNGVDFGSKVLIEALELPVVAEVLDVGCGYGPIGLSAARAVPNGHVTMLDINARAIELAKENAQLNKITNVSIMESDLFAAVQGKVFDVIVSNPPIRAGKDTVHSIFEQAYEHLRVGGALWIVIQKKQGAPSAREKLERLFGEVQEVTKEKGYRIFKAIKSEE
ncbi:class I SAM-dependent methyltransferase [Paenibacillus crassostreae]|uniref:16S rRNA methyltransferase n=1 Tax=Paenibacillus crassostreae TaxID=1763538 RepID=A0A167E6Q5_9BACL|nr:class I SAM-dependent methyltransferase [Paenibacillus crassostreae]AOZ93349.1 16S rRNA methyltransferase [Paenibacillus crassostreae]OAB75211.1 16S rRNA methyltransferase [Paenibacillus crassostreae]